MFSKITLNFSKSNVTELRELNNLFAKRRQRAKIIKNNFIQIVSINKLKNRVTNILNNLSKN